MKARDRIQALDMNQYMLYLTIFEDLDPRELLYPWKMLKSKTMFFD